MVARRRGRLSGQGMMRAALGFGVSGPHGARWFREGKLARLIAQALDGGVRHFDTAPFYGAAEERLGRALQGRADIFISTKTGTRRAGRRLVKDFSPAGMRADIEGSLLRLKREAVDLVYLHGPAPAEIAPALAALAALKAEGKVRLTGVCGDGEALEQALLAGADALMGVFNIVDRRHEPLFRRARAEGRHVAGIAPLVQGAIAGAAPPVTPAGLWRLARNIRRPAAAPDAVAAARARLVALEGFTPAAAALAFVLDSGACDVALTTTSNASHLAESLGAAKSDLSPLACAALGLDPSGTGS